MTDQAVINQIFIRTAIGTGFIFLMTTLGAATVFVIPGEPRRTSREIMYGFASGVMTAASVWSLLLPAMERTEQYGVMPGWLPAVIGMILGAAFLAIPDQYQSNQYQYKNNKYKKYNKNYKNYKNNKNNKNYNPDALLIAAVTLHNIPEGMAVGLACALSDNAAGAAALALGIGIQNFPEGAAVSLPCYQAGAGRLKAFRAGTLSGAVEPLSGFCAAFMAARSEIIMPWLLSFAAGAMLYAIQRELSPRASGYAGTCAYLTGFFLMMALDNAL